MKHIITKTIDGAIRLAFRIFGRDVYIEDDAPGRFFDFARDGGEWGEWEFWGLGLHLVTSPLKRRRPDTPPSSKP